MSIDYPLTLRQIADELEGKPFLEDRTALAIVYYGAAAELERLAAENAAMRAEKADLVSDLETEIDRVKTAFEKLAAKSVELAAENAALKAEVERLTPKEMTPQEVCDVLNNNAWYDCADWDHYDRDGGVIVESSYGYYCPFEAQCVAHGLLRDGAKGGKE